MSIDFSTARIKNVGPSLGCAVTRIYPASALLVLMRRKQNVKSLVLVSRVRIYKRGSCRRARCNPVYQSSFPECRAFVYSRRVSTRILRIFAKTHTSVYMYVYGYVFYVTAVCVLHRRAAVFVHYMHARARVLRVFASTRSRVLRMCFTRVCMFALCASGAHFTPAWILFLQCGVVLPIHVYTEVITSAGVWIDFPGRTVADEFIEESQGRH